MQRIVSGILAISVWLVPLESRAESQKSLMLRKFTNAADRELANAALNGDVSEVDKLLVSGVNINCQADDGSTPLMVAIICKNKKAVLLLLEKKADPNLFDKDNYTAVKLGAGMRDMWYLDILLKNGGNANAEDKRYKKTPMSAAILIGSLENINRLVDAGANINHRDGTGSTAMIMAANTNQYNIVMYFLRAGADPTIKDTWGHTILYYIQHPGGFIQTKDCTDVIAWLKAKKQWRIEK